MAVLEHLLEQDAEHFGDAEGDLERRRILVQSLQKVDYYFGSVQLLVSKLIRDVALFVHLAICALLLDAVATPRAQDTGRHHPRLNEHLRIVDRHVVSDFISNTCELLDDMHAAGVQEAPSSQPRRIDEINGVDDERISFPGSYAVPIVHC